MSHRDRFPGSAFLVFVGKVYHKFRFVSKMKIMPVVYRLFGLSILTSFMAVMDANCT